MPFITRELLRKRAEHNEGMISTLEEISLHQEEIESINEVLGMTCRKIKILYLQNNIIPRMENLHHLKDLQYLNMALNNVTKIEGLHNCEFLHKLDLTVNFVDVDTLKESIEHLATRSNLRELYMMGNPAESNWPNFKHYVTAKIPQLVNLDGSEITRSMRIAATQKLPALEAELASLAAKVRKEKAEKAKTIVEAVASAPVSGDVQVEDVDEEVERDLEDPNEMTDNTPEARVKMYKELAQQKAEKEAKQKENLPKERNYEHEQAQAIQQTRAKEEANGEREIKQKNEGGWEFYWDEESKPGFVVLDVRVQKFLDSSLIDVDVHPSYVSVIIKSKVLRLRLPAEVKASESKCQRSKASGSLVIIMPKVNPNENAISIRGDTKLREQQQQQRSDVRSGGSGGRTSRTTRTSASTSSTRPKKLTLQEQMMQEAMQQQQLQSGNGALLDSNIGNKSTSSNSVDVTNIVKKTQESGSRFDSNSNGLRNQQSKKPLIVQEIDPPATVTTTAATALPQDSSSAADKAASNKHQQQEKQQEKQNSAAEATTMAKENTAPSHAPTINPIKDTAHELPPTPPTPPSTDKTTTAATNEAKPTRSNQQQPQESSTGPTYSSNSGSNSGVSSSSFNMGEINSVAKKIDDDIAAAMGGGIAADNFVTSSRVEELD